MTILIPILLAAGSLTPPVPTTSAPAFTDGARSVPVRTLSAAVAAAAARPDLAVLLQGNAADASGPVRPRSRYTAPRRSLATKTTAVVAGAIIGSLAGLLGGAVVDAAAGNRECFPGMAIGMPVGAIAGGILTARLVR
jgi:hypothetical protein